jgi:hypothetical protein
MFRGYAHKISQIEPLDDLIRLFIALKGNNSTWRDKFIAEFEDPLDQDRMDALITLDNCTAHGLEDIKGTNNEKDKDLVAAIALIEGYKTLSERTVLVLIELSGQGSSDLKTLAEAAAQVRQKLFVFLRKQEQDKIPSGFDNCQSLFLEFLDKRTSEYQATEDLFRDNQIQVSNIDKLIEAWGKGISKFIADAQQTLNIGTEKIEFGDPMAIAKFLCMHECVETLYARLVTNVSGNE